MASYLLKGMRVILAAPSGPPNCAIEPGSILVKGDDGRLNRVGSVHQFVKSKGTKQYLLDQENDIEELPSGEGRSSFEVDSRLSASFWAWFLRPRVEHNASSTYILECTDAKIKSLKECPEVLKRFSEDIDIYNILMPESRTIAVVTSVCKSPQINVSVKMAWSVEGSAKFNMPTELTGLPPISAGVAVDASSSTAGERIWTASQGETFPVAVKGMVLRFASSGILIKKKHFGGDGSPDHEPTSEPAAGERIDGGPVVREEGDDDGELYEFLYGQGWPQWTTEEEQVQIPQVML